MNKRVKLIFTIIIFIIMLGVLRILWMSHLSPELYTGESEAGVMDLSTFSSEEVALYPLTGEWLYFPNELLTAEEITQNKQQAHVKAYPEDWLAEKDNNEFTYGTFYMQLFLPEYLVGESLSFHVPRARLASRLYIDDMEIGASGIPANNEADFEASMSPYVAHFFTEKKVIELVLHVSNDGLKSPTPVTSIAFGTTDSIESNKTFSIMSKFIIVMAFCFILLFAIYLYFYSQSNEKKMMLYLIIYLFFNILTVLLDYDQVLLLKLPFSHEINSKILRMSYVFMALFAFQFFKHFLAAYKTRSLYNYYPYVSGIYVLFVLVFPLRLIETFSLLLLLVFLVPLIYIVEKFFRAVRDDAEDVDLLLLMGIALLNNLLWSVYKTVTNTLTFEFYPIDTLIALFLFALYWLRKYLRHTEKIEELTEELIEKDQSKDDFLAQTSHELRNPLHSMINIAQLVADNPKNILEKDDREGMDLLLSVGKRMSFLVDDLLDLSLMSERRLRLQQSPVYLQTVVTTVIEMVAYLNKPKKVTIQHHIATDFPPVYADESRVIQLVLNLIHNAIKFTDEGEIVITAHVVDGEAVIRVKDTGRGMDASYVDKVFEPFFKGDEVEGIGLGLQVTKELVELHGGIIKVDSTLGVGTTVTFTLPLVDGDSLEALKTHGRRKVDVQSQRGELPEMLIAATLHDSEVSFDETSDTKEAERLDFTPSEILLVDDDHVNLEVMAKVLQAVGYAVTTVLSGEAALEKIQTIRFDLIISDVMMPHMSGYELVKEIRKLYDLSELPIVLLTARGKTDDLNAGFQAGANDYLVKPVDAQELKARVKALTDLQVAVKDQLRLEAAWLRAQMNPHFLYNTINSIMMMARANPERMQYLLEKFVYFLRTSYDFQSKQSLVTLREELKLIDAYLTIEKERFGDRLQIVWAMDESLHVLIPPLSLQTLVENALKHGILNRIEGGTVTLQSIEEDEYISLIVADDGVGMPADTIAKIHRHELAKGDGIGLINTDKRLRRWLQTPLDIESELGVGTTMTIRIEKRFIGQEHNEK